jgi:hypothetical protein
LKEKEEGRGRGRGRGSTRRTQELICWIRIDEKKGQLPERERERDQKENIKEMVEHEDKSK